jgi:hypothetical protein
MSAAELLHELSTAGFRLRIEGDKLLVSPFSDLSAARREQIKAHRDALVELLRQPEEADARVVCIACRHHVGAGHRCLNHRRAGLSTNEVGPDLAALPQRCKGHAPRSAT